MFKRYFIVFLSVAFMLSLYFTVNKPLFSDYADIYELYLKENSSIAGIVNADKYSFPFYFSVKGEACVVKCGDEKKIIGDFNAETVFTEEINIRRITPHSCRKFFADSSEIKSALCAISIQYSVS